MNFFIFTESFFPGEDSTPELTSNPAQGTIDNALSTLSGFNPPHNK